MPEIPEKPQDLFEIKGVLTKFMRMLFPLEFRIDSLANGAPIALIYPTEGTPAAVLNGVVMQQAPHPNAARLFISFMFSPEGQQIFVDYGFRSLHPEVHEPAGRKPLSEIKILRTDPQEQEQAGEEIKIRYARYFGT